ncbi:MAG TPA: sulfotransferase domain-containing protein [Planctomycetota bacterium]|nr:sulfotransferase domain-containing protein [Planctomycetota bacterium]
MSLLSRSKETIKAGLNLHSGRGITVLPDDTFIVSYPKSGNTWTRFLIGALYFGKPMLFSNIEEKVPDIYQNTNKALLRVAQPRILKSHEYFEPRYRRVIYIARDPRDVLVSYYFHFRKFNYITDAVSLEEFAQSFFAGTLDPFGTWGENVGSWLGAREHNADFLLLRYEDMLRDTRAEARRIVAFLKLSATDAQLDAAISSSSADNMRQLEREQGDQWKPLRETRKTIPFVRSAESGGWTKQLSPALAKAVEALWPQQMRRLGYS